jgi:hypothetical protein
MAFMDNSAGDHIPPPPSRFHLRALRFGGQVGEAGLRKV